MVAWTDDVPTDGSVELPPDPRAMDAIGRNHSPETALADLVDNSLDAGASHVVIRVVRATGRLRSLYVVDNGRGISPDQIDSAMTIGGRRSYGSDDLGHFGLGLKAASFSQARSLTVMSSAERHHPVGRRWRLDTSANSFACDTVPTHFAARELEADWGIPSAGSGTAIRWDDVSAFPASDEPHRIEAFINHIITAACQHLGLVFHRFLEQDRLQLAIEVHDVERPGEKTRVDVTPLNPFGYTRSGHPDFPKDIKGEIDTREIVFRCHIWPGRSNTAEFRLPGGPVDRQGLYFYRHDRLLHAGGWDGIHAPSKRLQLARVEVEVEDDIVGLFRMNPEKSKVLVGPEFARVCESARSTHGVSLSGYFDIAEQVFRKSRERSRARKSMIQAGTGFPPRVRSVLHNEIPMIHGEDPIDIRWQRFSDQSFFHIDREERTIWLNKKYRKALLGGRRGGLNDVPVLKALLYLLMEDVFEGDFLGARDKDNIDLWQEVLTSAARAEPE